MKSIAIKIFLRQYIFYLVQLFYRMFEALVSYLKVLVIYRLNILISFLIIFGFLE
jgi:hypothetical protein